MEDLLIEMWLDLIGVENGVERVCVVVLHLTYCILIANILSSPTSEKIMSNKI